MTFAQLQERLRLEILRRIARDSLSRSLLARRTGFRQSHISNFLRDKRRLSGVGFDRLLHATALSIEDLLRYQRASIADSSAAPHPDFPGWVEVPLVSSAAAASAPHIHASLLLQRIPIHASVLQGLAHDAPTRRRRDWDRFVAIRVDATLASAARPLLHLDAVVLIDRHYTALRPYEPSRPTLYAVHRRGSLTVAYLSRDEDRLLLRPHNILHRVELLPSSAQQKYPDAIVGRPFFTLSEL